MSAPFIIYAGNEPIGTSKLEHSDPSMGIAFGVFRPAPAYERVRWVFRLFAEAEAQGATHDSPELSRYYAERDRLDLRLAGPDGRAIETSFIHIVDYSVELGDADAMEVTVQLPGGMESPSE